MDFDTNSDSNSIPSMNGSADELIGTNQTKHHVKVNKYVSQGSNGVNVTPTRNPTNSTTKTIAASTNQLISSCSLSSSLSSTSSSSSSSSILAHSNVAGQAAPLAAITELANFSASPSLRTDHSSTLPINFHSKNEDTDLKKEFENNVRSYRNGSLGSRTGLSSSNTSSNTMVNECGGNETLEPDNPLSKPHLNSSITSIDTSYNKEFYKISKNKKASITNNFDFKYSSTSSMNRKASTSELTKKQLQQQQQQQQQPSSQKSSPVHSVSGANKSLRNFFGKLIRTSLVNINESSFNSSISNLNDAKPNGKPKIDQANLNASTNSAFKRGGIRATANARLQNNFSMSNNSLLSSHRTIQNVDTLTFAKFNPRQVYEWLCKQGFDSYFPVNLEGNYINKWIKNGLHLLQASQHDYEKV